MSHDYFRPLNSHEFVELDELLTALDENLGAMSADEMDGFLTAILLLPDEVSPREWMPMIFSATDQIGKLSDTKKQDRLEELIYRRYKQIDHQLSQCEGIDPITFDVEDDDGNILDGEAELTALQPFALGFLTAAQSWPGLLDTENEKLMSALLGIFRHLPEENLGDLQEIYQELQLENPIDNIDDALMDIAQSVIEIAAITRGFIPESTDKKAQPKKKFHH